MTTIIPSQADKGHNYPTEIDWDKLSWATTTLTRIGSSNNLVRL